MDQDRLFGVEGLSELGWRVPEGLTRERWLEGMERLQVAEHVGPWGVADGMAAGLMAYGDEAWQALGLHYEEKSVNRMLSVAGAFPIDRRRPGVSLWKAEVFKGLPEPERWQLMEDASARSFTMDTIRDLVAEWEGQHNAERLDGHARECPSCGALSDYWQRVPAEMREAPDPEPEPVGAAPVARELPPGQGGTLRAGRPATERGAGPRAQRRKETRPR